MIIFFLLINKKLNSLISIEIFIKINIKNFTINNIFIKKINKKLLLKYNINFFYI